ncbi:hypothetical protein GT94_07905 [Geobacillus stearothermophilus]|nr:tRNA(fMet)-specific endonuclease VapC [Geobacillus sp. 12AMOR1]ATA60915.1 PIN domain-containing protein [Geobacillus stearothermophilus]NNU98546.1 type II toxin-antitoxin system VapC family toxin [Geobacillus sp. DSP4a]PJW13013.1 PIN domain-containing protein [Geobacillus sp. Manikaran-105]PJW16076.1 PIN domain-containing protein [Geobacillus sp. WSUCF-018B]STO13287.1 PIN domain [[Flavobacterium] thermophilum]
MSLSNIALIDNNIYVYHYLGYEPVKHLFTQLLNDGFEIAMSSVVAMEFLSYEKVETNEAIRHKRYSYIRASTLYNVDFEIAEKAAELRRKCKMETGKTLKAGDALIAATAIAKGMTLFSNNDKDFVRLQKWGLNYVNPIQDPEDLQKFLNKLL